MNHQSFTRSFFYNRAPTSIQPPSVLDIPSYTLADARMGFNTGAWGAQVWIRNLTDKYYSFDASLLPIHVRRGWHQRKNLLAGCVVSTVALLLIASGYALYYYGGEEARPWISAFHWLLGLGTPVLLVWHVWRGRQLLGRRVQRG